MEKMTYVSVLNDVINGENLTDAHYEKLHALIDRLNKANSRPKSDKPTKAQREKASADAEMCESIIGAMSDRESYTTTQCAEFVGVSTSKATHLMKMLTEAGRVSKEIVKNKAYFTLTADAEVDAE